jgi:hypothetical protein
MVGDRGSKFHNLIYVAKKIQHKINIFLGGGLSRGTYSPNLKLSKAFPRTFANLNTLSADKKRFLGFKNLRK